MKSAKARRSMINFMGVDKTDPKIVKFSEKPDSFESNPYDIRTGRVLGKYVLEDLFSCDKKERYWHYIEPYRKGEKVL